MASKKTGKKAVRRVRRRKNKNRNLFVLSLTVVLAAGSLAMLGYSAVMKGLDAGRNKSAEKVPMVVDFSGLASRTASQGRGRQMHQQMAQPGRGRASKRVFRGSRFLRRKRKCSRRMNGFSVRRFRRGKRSISSIAWTASVSHLRLRGYPAGRRVCHDVPLQDEGERHQ